MSKTKNDPAFPEFKRNVQYGEEYLSPEKGGITKRELFAAMALQGFLANATLMDAAYKVSEVVEGAGLNRIHAKWAVHAADTLLAELERENE